MLFFIFALLLWNAVRADPQGRFRIILGAGLIVGSMSEYLQSFFPGRDPALRDVLLNFGSTAIGAAARLLGSSPDRARPPEPAVQPEPYPAEQSARSESI